MNVRRCFQEAAKATRKGKDITRAVNLTDPTQPNATLLFADQDKTPEELFTMDRYSTSQSLVSPLAGYPDAVADSIRGALP